MGIYILRTHINGDMLKHIYICVCVCVCLYLYISMYVYIYIYSIHVFKNGNNI